MDAGVVEAITRWVGVTITLVGAFIVSPAATVALLGRWQRRTLGAVRRLGDAVRKLVRRPRRIAGTLDGALPGMSGSVFGKVTWKGTVVGEAPDQSVEGRLDRLEQRAAAAEARLSEVSQQAAADRAELREALGTVAEEQRAGTARLHARLDYTEEQAVEVDAAALPVVAIGVFVSGLSPDAHRLPVVVWTLVLLGALALTVGGVRRAWRRRRQHAATDALRP